MADDDRPRIDLDDLSIRVRVTAETSQGVRQIIRPPDPPRRPRPVPSVELRAVVEALVELLARHREEFTRLDDSGALRTLYERFRCELQAAGFRVDHLSRQRRAQHFRAIGEQLEASGHPAAAADFYDWAVASWKSIGCAARATRLRRLLETRQMSARVVPGRDPRKVPSFVLWTMYKEGHTREARTRLLPVGDSLVELAIYERRRDGMFDLLWAQTLASGALVNELAQQVQREYEVEGWTLETAVLARDLPVDG